MEKIIDKKYDAIIIGAGPAGIYASLKILESGKSVYLVDKGNILSKRECPITLGKAKTCVRCKHCSIMTGFGGAGAFSDGKYNITNEFGGSLWEKIGIKKAISYMELIDSINTSLLEGSEIPELFDSGLTDLKDKFIKEDLHLLNAKIRHLGTDNNYTLLEKLWDKLKSYKDFNYSFDTEAANIEYINGDYKVLLSNNLYVSAPCCVVGVGRSGSKWMGQVCQNLKIPTTSNRVDIGVRVELPFEVFKEITDKLYEGKIVYRTKNFEDKVRTFCMNPRGAVVNENTNGIITVNGHSYEGEDKKTDNTNFALLVEQTLTEPFDSSTEYGENIAKLSNMLGNGVIVQRFGDLIRGRRSTKSRIESSTVIPTLDACPGDLSLVLPKRILDNIIEMVYKLDKVAKGTANDDTLLYGVEVKFYNMNVKVNNNLEADGYKNLYIIGDGSGLTHSLSQAAASGLFVGEEISKK